MSICSCSKTSDPLFSPCQTVKSKTQLHCKLLPILFNDKERLSGKYNSSQSTHRKHKLRGIAERPFRGEHVTWCQKRFNPHCQTVHVAR